MPHDTEPLPSINISINGRPVAGELLSASAGIGGYERATVRIPEREVNRRRPVQGSVLTVWQSNGRRLWEGRLALTPIVRSGAAVLEASGYQVAALKKHGRLLFQTRDIGVWTNVAGSPYNYSVPEVQSDIRNAVVTTFINPEAGVDGMDSRVGAWFPGIDGITRYAFDVVQAGAVTSLAVATRFTDDPTDSSGTLEITHSNTPPYSVDRTVSVAPNKEVMFIHISCVMNAQTKGYVALRNIRVNGVGTTDTLYSSDVFREMAAKLGWTYTPTTNTNLNILPLDVESGAWADTMTYLAVLDDTFWRVLGDDGGGPKLEVVDWSRVWSVLLEDGARENLQPRELFNQASVFYNDVGGAPRSITRSASPDPLAASRITNSFEVELRDAQNDTTLAQTVGDTVLAHYAKPRYSGAVEVWRASRDDGSTGGPFDILPGDVVRIEDWPDGPLDLRIYDVDYGNGKDSVTLGIEDVDPLERVLGHAAIESAKVIGPIPSFDEEIFEESLDEVSVEAEPYYANLEALLGGGGYGGGGGGSGGGRRKKRRRGSPGPGGGG